MNGEKRTFDPSQYLINVKGGAEYLEVKWRLAWFRAEHPNGNIDTEAVEISERIAIFKAKVGYQDGDEYGSATGFGSETPKDFGDYIEKAETKAIGRALAALGYGTQFTDDHEMQSSDGAAHVVDAPVKPRQTKRASESRQPVNLNAPEPEIVDSPDMATQRQIGLISKLAEEAGYDEDSLKSVWVKGVYGCDSRKDLTKAQASELIHKLQVSGFAERLKTAESEKDLNLIAADIKAAGVTGQERKGLGDVYSARIEQLTSSEGDEELDKAFDDAVSQVELS